MEETTGLVAYTDGSARPNPGPAGSGIHGYIYVKKGDDKKVTVDSHIVTDKAYVPCLHPLKDQKLVTPLHYFDSVVAHSNPHSNNYAEVAAFYRVLEIAEEHGVKHIHVNTDSQYLIKGVEVGLKYWPRQDWKKQDGSPVPNAALFKKIYEKLKILKGNSITLAIEWVKGHNNIFGNTHADTLAAIGMNYSFHGEATTLTHVTEAKKYWSYDTDRHPLLSNRRVYFNSVAEHNRPGCYYQAESGSSDLIFGKPLPEESFSVLRLKNGDDQIEAVRQQQYHVSRGVNAIFMLNMDHLFSKGVHRLIKQYGGKALMVKRSTSNLETPDQLPITSEQNPTGLSLRALECINHLDGLLDRFLEYQASTFDVPGNNIQMKAHDITSIFFDEVEKKNKTETVLKPEFVVGYVNHSVTIGEQYKDDVLEVPIPLILGKDLPARNNLKRLESLCPKIHVITWREAEQTVRHAVVIQCSDGVGIWSNYYSNRIFLNNFTRS